MPFCMLSQAGRASASHRNVLPQHGRREGRYHAVVEKEVGFSQRRVTFFKCAIRSIFKYKQGVQPFHPLAYIFGQENLALLPHLLSLLVSY